MEEKVKAENLKIIGAALRQTGDEMRRNNEKVKAMQLHFTWMRLLRIYDYVQLQNLKDESEYEGTTAKI